MVEGHESTFSLGQEIDEFFSYTEMTRHLDNQRTFHDIVEGWSDTKPSEQKAIIIIWLETLKSSDRIRRYRSCQCLLYLAQGEFGKFSTPAEQLQQLTTNNLLFYNMGAFDIYYNALRTACQNHENVATAVLSQRSTNLVNSMNDLNFEIGLLLSLLYLLVEVCRHNIPKLDFANNIVELEPPIAPFLFSQIAKLKEKSFKGYPIKKVLLLLWKVLLGLSCDLSYFKELKDYQRRKYNLPPKPEPDEPKVEPEEFNLFNLELSKKYPSCSIKLGNNYFTTPPTGLRWSLNGERQLPNSLKSQSSLILDANTTETYPFLLPFTRNQSDIPTPIKEASELYQKHLYFPLSFVQLLHTSIPMYNLLQHPDTRLPPNVPLPEHISYLKPTPDNPDSEYQACLDRIEILYRQLLPESYAIVVVLLKLLLATVPAPRGKDDSVDTPDSARPLGFPPRSNPFDKGGGNAAPPFDTPMHLSVDEVDDIRHKEIVSKASSSIILHILKIFKVSDAAKFEYYSLMLVDSNAILLILKLYGLQDFSSLTKVRNECDHLCFFKALLRPKPQSSKDSDEPALSPLNLPFPRGRTLYTALNFFRVLYMLTKDKISRILLLVQFRSTIIFKRALRSSHPLLLKYLYKILKNQIPFLGRKWKQNNMKLITSIYLKCNHGMKEEWVLPVNLEGFAEVQNKAIRDLVTFYHGSGYAEYDFHQVQQLSQEDLSKKPSNQSFKHVPIRPSRSQSSNSTHTLGSTPHQKNVLHYSKSVNSLSHMNISSTYQGGLDLDDDFMHNYEDWLEQEVYNQPPEEVNETSDWNDTRSLSPDLDESMRTLVIDEADNFAMVKLPLQGTFSTNSASPPLSPA